MNCQDEHYKIEATNIIARSGLNLSTNKVIKVINVPTRTTKITNNLTIFKVNTATSFVNLPLVMIKPIYKWNNIILKRIAKVKYKIWSYPLMLLSQSNGRSSTIKDILHSIYSNNKYLSRKNQ